MRCEWCAGPRALRLGALGHPAREFTPESISPVRLPFYSARWEDDRDWGSPSQEGTARQRGVNFGTLALLPEQRVQRQQGRLAMCLRDFAREVTAKTGGRHPQHRRVG